MPSLVNPDPTRLETSGISDSIARAIDPVVAQPAGAIEQAARNNILALREGFAAGENLMRLPLRNAAAKNQLEEFNAAGKLRPITQQTEEARLKMLNDEMAELPLRRERAEEAYQYGIKQQAARRVFEKNVAEMGSMAGKDAELRSKLEADDAETFKADQPVGPLSPEALAPFEAREAARKATREAAISRLTKAPTYLDILGEASKAGFNMSPSDRKELQDELAKRGGAAFPVLDGYRVASVTVNDDGSKKTTLEPIPPTGPVTAELDANGKPTGFFKDASGKPVPPTEQAAKLAKSREEYPEREAAIDSSIAAIKSMIGDTTVVNGELVEGPIKPHPGFASAVGFGIGNAHWPGSSGADFLTRHKQVTGAAFLEAFASLKGAGAITDMEGQKATAAITRLSTIGSEVEYILAARELLATLESTKVRARARLGITDSKSDLEKKAAEKQAAEKQAADWATKTASAKDEGARSAARGSVNPGLPMLPPINNNQAPVLPPVKTQSAPVTEHSAPVTEHSAGPSPVQSDNDVKEAELRAQADAAIATGKDPVKVKAMLAAELLKLQK